MQSGCLRMFLPKGLRGLGAFHPPPPHTHSHLRLAHAPFHPPLQLVPLAVAAFVLYGLGVPCLYGVLLYRYRVEIRADQNLRVQALGFTRGTNPHFSVRQRCVAWGRGGVGAWGLHLLNFTLFEAWWLLGVCTCAL